MSHHHTINNIELLFIKFTYICIHTILHAAIKFKISTRQTMVNFIKDGKFLKAHFYAFLSKKQDCWNFVFAFTESQRKMLYKGVKYFEIKFLIIINLTLYLNVCN